VCPPITFFIQTVVKELNWVQYLVPGFHGNRVPGFQGSKVPGFIFEKYIFLKKGRKKL